MRSLPLPQEQHSLRELVREKYASIATGKETVCCSTSGCCGTKDVDAEALAKSLGYETSDLAALPEGSNMGLSCGNPVAIAALQPGQVVLDLGSGGGFDVFQAGRRVGASGRVIGVDMTPEMLAKARANTAVYKEQTGLDNVEFRLGEIEHLPVADSSIDVLISNCVINLSPNKEQVWSEIFRVLKPMGKVAVSDMGLFKPLPPAIESMTAALVGCISGAMLLHDTRRLMELCGFLSVELTPRPEYIRQMVSLNQPVYQDIIACLPPGEALEQYITSVNIEAVKGL